MGEPPVISTSTDPHSLADAQIAEEKPKRSGKKVLDNRLAIFLMLFCVTGFLGIPVLCMSPAFSRSEKVIWSIVVTIYTCILIAITAWIVWYVYSMYVDLYS
ncbi:MAG: hypothetical protein ACE361_23410 [Aureliella sp.]